MPKPIDVPELIAELEWRAGPRNVCPLDDPSLKGVYANTSDLRLQRLSAQALAAFIGYQQEGKNDD